jgi:hypothetical protein
VKQKGLAKSTDEALMTNKIKRKSGGAGRSRTALDGFAIHCITALLPRLVMTNYSLHLPQLNRCGANEKGQHFYVLPF